MISFVELVSDYCVKQVKKNQIFVLPFLFFPINTYNTRYIQHLGTTTAISFLNNRFKIRIMRKVYNKILLLATGFLFISNVMIAQQSVVQGNVLYHGESPIADVNVYLNDVNGNIVDSTITNPTGHFVFNQITPGDYILSCSTTIPPNLVDLNDAFSILLHLMGLYPFDPIQELAADVDGDGSVTWDDYFTIVIGYFTYGNPFPVGDWVFEDVAVTVNGSRDGTGIGGSSSGDVNGTYVPDKNLFINISDDSETLMSEINRKFNLEIKAKDALKTNGFHLELNIPEEIEVINIESQFDDLNYNIAGNKLYITWLDQTMNSRSVRSGETLLTINALFNGDRAPAYELSIQPEQTSHFIDENGQLLENITIKVPKILITGPVQDQSEEIIDGKVYPNPFINEITFDYELTEAGNFSIEIYNTSGQLVKLAYNGFKQAGPHKSNIYTEDLLPGYYIYKMLIQGKPGSVKTGSMIKVR